MAITAMKTGARLPLVPSRAGQPPEPRTKQIVRYVPSELQQYERVLFVHTPCLSLYPIIEPSEDTEAEPEAFAVSASLSICHASF